MQACPSSLDQKIDGIVFAIAIANPLIHQRAVFLRHEGYFSHQASRRRGSAIRPHEGKRRCKGAQGLRKCRIKPGKPFFNPRQIRRRKLVRCRTGEVGC